MVCVVDAMEAGPATRLDPRRRCCGDGWVGRVARSASEVAWLVGVASHTLDATRAERERMPRSSHFHRPPFQVFLFDKLRSNIEGSCDGHIAKLSHEPKET